MVIAPVLLNSNFFSSKRSTVTNSDEDPEVNNHPPTHHNNQHHLGLRFVIRQPEKYLQRNKSDRSSLTHCCKKARKPDSRSTSEQGFLSDLWKFNFTKFSGRQKSYWISAYWASAYALPPNSLKDLSLIFLSPLYFSQAISCTSRHQITSKPK